MQKKSFHRHQIRSGERKVAFAVAVKLRVDDDIVRASRIVDAEGRAAAVFGGQICEGILRAFGFGRRPHAVCGELF